METVYSNSNNKQLLLNVMFVFLKPLLQAVNLNIYLQKNHQVKPINASDIPFISSAAAQIPLLSSFWTQAHAVFLKMLKGPKVRALHHLFEHHIMENMKERLFWLKIERTLKETPIMLRLFPPIKNRADRYTHKPMAPFTVGPLCPTVFKSKSLWLNEHIPGRTWDCSEGSQCCNILKRFR